jgi:hypothetical protein
VGESLFEAMQFVEPAFGPGEKFPGTLETQLGVFETQVEAQEVAREAWRQHRASDSHDVAWWIVRAPGETAALWIADSRSAKERILDLRTNTLVEVE